MPNHDPTCTEMLDWLEANPNRISYATAYAAGRPGKPRGQWGYTKGGFWQPAKSLRDAIRRAQRCT